MVPRRARGARCGRRRRRWSDHRSAPEPRPRAVRRLPIADLRELRRARGPRERGGARGRARCPRRGAGLKVSIAGLGLIGGSLALALKTRHRVSGFDIDASTREAALAAGIDVVGALEALLPADAVIVATPMAAIVPTLASLAQRSGAAVLLDVASVRAPVEAFAKSAPNGCRIVGLHPMAGRSGSGFAAASAKMLELRPFLVVPTVRSDTASMAIAGALARDAGGEVTVCSAAQHDRIVAVLSALPLAFASALALAGAETVDGNLAALSGPGFGDSTRLALTSPDLGSAMLLANARNVRGALERARMILDEVDRAIAAGDFAALSAILERAAQARRRLS
ncbi:MAG: prephenate dehydrogenase/arogenate dehydrogenase family protein [Chloroflexi bacterium]|nr:MAG: prephenate dehydrogenase/arogenate dehydrogenase family protein [Chloroflexota bacterium]